jgi:hypothetical protein
MHRGTFWITHWARLCALLALADLLTARDPLPMIRDRVSILDLRLLRQDSVTVSFAHPDGVVAGQIRVQKSLLSRRASI